MSHLSEKELSMIGDLLSDEELLTKKFQMLASQTQDAEIKQYQKRRDGFNHMTVMYKKSSVLKAGNYQNCMLMEDTYLWVNMFIAGCTAVNIDDFLVYARIGKDMFERRMVDYHYTLLVQLVVAMIPNKIRGWVFKKLLHH